MSPQMSVCLHIRGGCKYSQQSSQIGDVCFFFGLHKFSLYAFRFSPNNAIYRKYMRKLHIELCHHRICFIPYTNTLYLFWGCCFHWDFIFIVVAVVEYFCFASRSFSLFASLLLFCFCFVRTPTTQHSLDSRVCVLYCKWLLFKIENLNDSCALAEFSFECQLGNRMIEFRIFINFISQKASRLETKRNRQQNEKEPNKFQKFYRHKQLIQMELRNKSQHWNETHCNASKRIAADIVYSIQCIPQLSHCLCL